MRDARPLVLVDADDTLWENFTFFQEATDAWARWMESRGVPSARALAALEACEDRNIPRTGYGAAPFVASMREAFDELLPAADAAERRAFAQLADRSEAEIRGHPIRLLPGVDGAVRELASHARLVLFTKGREDEQLAKFARSGLAGLFHGATVVPDKHVAAYATECARRGVAPERAWMIGNSARSDVNPARRAGLRTIHVPHAAPWHRDEEPLVDAGPPTRVARTFADVPRIYFSAS